MSLRREFVLLATQSGANVRELCRRFQISAKTAYKWIDRFRRDGVAALARINRVAHIARRGAVLVRWSEPL